MSPPLLLLHNIMQQTDSLLTLSEKRQTTEPVTHARQPVENYAHRSPNKSFEPTQNLCKPNENIITTLYNLKITLMVSIQATKY